MAVCPTCGKSYQAPDSMAGKSVRCKQCQTVFKIDAPDSFGEDLEGSQVDFDQLQRSFEGEDAEATAAGTRVGGPMVDADGRVSIRRAADVSSMGVRGDASGGGKRTNLRFRYPFARQVDVGLPFVIVLLALVVPLWLSLTTGAKPGEPVPQGVGISRYAVLLVAFLVCVVPLVHFAAGKASDAVHFNLPRNPFWRSFAAASATLLLASTLFILAGGSIGGAIMGILVGTAATVAASLLLYRAVPHEMGTLSAYVGGAAAVGAAVAAALIAGINFAGASVARSQENPTLFQSPIAIGAPWVDQKAVADARPAPRPSPGAPKQNPTAAAPTVPAQPAVAAQPTAPQPVPLALEQFIGDAEARKFVKSADQLPVAAGFRTVITTLTPSKTVGVVRDVGGGLVELWDAARWILPDGAVGRGFDFNQSPLFVNATGDRVVRLVTSPYLRIEAIPLASGGASMTPVKVETDANRSIEGFLDASTLLVRANSNRGLSFEQYDLAKTPSQVNATPEAIGTPGADTVSRPMSIDVNSPSVAFLPEKKLVVAGRTHGGQASVGLFSLDRLGEPEKLCDVPWQDPTNFSPLAMAADPAGGKVALMMDTAGEAWLSIWRLQDETVDGASVQAAETYLVEHKLGPLGTLRAGGRWQDADDALVWLDRDTLLLYGQHVIDARTATLLGTVPIANVTHLIRLGDGEVAYTAENGGLRNLIRVKFDLAYIASLRK